MTTCPNCSSAAAVGTDVASVCSECAAVSVAGASFSLPMLLVGAGLVALTAVAAPRLWRHGAGLFRLGRPALG